jgi:hypothetical protein
MPSCPNGHVQRLGLKCQTCGADLSYRNSIEELRELPRVEPHYGRVSVLVVGVSRLSLKADYVGEVSIGQADAKTPTGFSVQSIRGGSWLDFSKKYQRELRRWIAIVGVDKAIERFVVVDTTDPLSVLALSVLPELEHTVLFAIVADPDSTPVQQNTSYVALSVALKKGFPVIALSQTFEREMLYFTEDGGFATDADALSRLLQSLLHAKDDLMDLLERDLKLGIRVHSLSAILAGSENVYGIATNAFMAQSYNISMQGTDDCQTVHSLVFTRRAEEKEFVRSFGVFRNRKFKGALSAEFRFHETPSSLYDLLTIYGMKSETSLQGISGGYDAIVKSVPELSVEGVP